MSKSGLIKPNYEALLWTLKHFCFKTRQCTWHLTQILTRDVCPPKIWCSLIPHLWETGTVWGHRASTSRETSPAPSTSGWSTVNCLCHLAQNSAENAQRDAGCLSQCYGRWEWWDPEFCGQTWLQTFLCIQAYYNILWNMVHYILVIMQ